MLGHVTAEPKRLRHHYNGTFNAALLIPVPVPSKLEQRTWSVCCPPISPSRPPGAQPSSEEETSEWLRAYLLPRLPPPTLLPSNIPAARQRKPAPAAGASARMEQDRDSRNDIDGITLPMRGGEQEMHLQTLLQQASVAAAAAAAQSFAVPTARVAAGYG